MKIISGDRTPKVRVQVGNKQFSKDWLAMRDCPLNQKAQLLLFLEKNLFRPTDRSGKPIHLKYERRVNAPFIFAQAIILFEQVWNLVVDGKVKAFWDLELGEADVPEGDNDKILWTDEVIQASIWSQNRLRLLVGKISRASAPLKMDGTPNPNHDKGISDGLRALHIMQQLWDDLGRARTEEDMERLARMTIVMEEEEEDTSPEMTVIERLREDMGGMNVSPEDLEDEPASEPAPKPTRAPKPRTRKPRARKDEDKAEGKGKAKPKADDEAAA